MGDTRVPLQIVKAVAPIRICDNGGWTDTWFAGHGKVFNIGVYPCVEVQVKVHPIGAVADRILLDAENYDETYAFEPGALPNRHPLLEAAIDDIGLPDDLSVEINVFSEVPAGCSTGTSAAATVALIGALDSLTPGSLTPHEVAYAAHRIEADRLKTQSGIQDQLRSLRRHQLHRDVLVSPRLGVEAGAAQYRVVGAGAAPGPGISGSHACVLGSA